MPTALITGATGQDGLHLAAHLRRLGYRVVAIAQFGSRYEHDLISRHAGDIQVVACDITDLVSVVTTIRETSPDEIYNLAAISSVRTSWEQPLRTCDVNGNGLLTILEAVRLAERTAETKIFQASSAQLFGDVDGESFNEETPIRPTTPYGASKAFAHFMAASYRARYGMFVSCGILGNHESGLHDEGFVVPRITSTVARIAVGHASELVLDNLTATRDWGYAGDFVVAMHAALQHPTAEDFVIATGELHTVEDVVNAAFQAAGITGWRSMVRLTGRATGQPQRIPRADISKAKRLLGWKPTMTFDELIAHMVADAIASERATDPAPIGGRE
ncbi:MAG: GDP-mannose 4,6-dehydratase [Pseudonocardiaceae bacterium]